MDSPRPGRNAGQRRKRRKDQKIRLDVLEKIMEEQGWGADELAERSGLSIQTVTRILNGEYIRRNSAKDLQEALADYATDSLFESKLGDPEAASADQGLASSPSPLERLYRACDLLRGDLRHYVRVRQFTSLIEERTRDFVGRQWLFDALDGFLREHRSGYFLVRGKPGIGKTAFAAEVTRRRGCVHHFNSRFTSLNRTEQFLTNVCAQLIGVFGLPPTLPARAAEDCGILDDLLSKAVRSHPHEKVLLVVDALDETEQKPSDLGNPLALPTRLPQGSYMLLTLCDVDREPRFECPCQRLFLEQRSDGNLQDVRLFLHKQTAKSGIKAYIARHNLGKDGFVKLLEDKSQGNFMYLRCVLPEIEAGRFADRDWKELPEGLTNYYEQHWTLLRDADRTNWFGIKLPILLALATAREPVSVRLLADRLPKLPPASIRDVLRHDRRQFLEQEQLRLGDATVTAWRLYHASFADFLRAKAADPEEQVDLERERDAWLDYGQQHGFTPD